MVNFIFTDPAHNSSVEVIGELITEAFVILRVCARDYADSAYTFPETGLMGQSTAKWPPFPHAGQRVVSFFKNKLHDVLLWSWPYKPHFKQSPFPTFSSLASKRPVELALGERDCLRWTPAASRELLLLRSRERPLARSRDGVRRRRSL
jgi:hypothetical protein